MNNEHAEHAEVGSWVAAYLLGALDAGDRRRFERHQATCARCQAELAELAPISSLLSRVDPTEVDPVPAGASSAAEAAVGASAAAEYRRLMADRRRWRRVASVAVAAALALAAVAAVDLVRNHRPTPPPPPSGSATAAATPPVVPAEIVDSQVKTAVLTTSSRGWGTEVGLQVTGLPQRDWYQLWAVTHDGSWRGVATWGPTASGACRLTSATSLHPEMVDYLVVTSADRGEVLVKAQVRTA